MSVATEARLSAAGSPRPAGTPIAPVRRASSPPALHVVPAPPWRAPLAPFILVSVSVVVAGLLGLLLLNTLVATDSFRARALERESTLLHEREQTLHSDVAKLQAPGILAHRAKAQGMVPGNTPGFLRLGDGRVTGELKAAVAPAPPPPVPAGPALTIAPPVVDMPPQTEPDPVLVPTPPAAGNRPKAAKPATTTKSATTTKPVATKPGAKKPLTTKPGAARPAVKTPAAKAPVVP